MRSYLMAKKTKGKLEIQPDDDDRRRNKRKNVAQPILAARASMPLGRKVLYGDRQAVVDQASR